MTSEEMAKTRQFILDQQAKVTVRLAKVTVKLEIVSEKIDRLTEDLTKLLILSKRTHQRIVALARRIDQQLAA